MREEEIGNFETSMYVFGVSPKGRSSSLPARTIDLIFSARTSPPRSRLKISLRDLLDATCKVLFFQL